MAEKRKWTFSKKFSAIFKIFKINNQNVPDFLIEILICIHVYILAAYLAIREFVFDYFNSMKIENELQKFATAENDVSKYALVTGADGTIGIEIVKKLIKLGYQIIGLVKNKTEEMENLENLTIFEVDLFNKSNVKKVGLEIKKRFEKIDLAFFTAGVMLVPKLHDFDGIESHNVINVISQGILFDIISQKVEKSIFLSSATARIACFPLEKNFLSIYAGPYQAYSSSKLYLAIYVDQLAKNRSLSVVSCHPGTVPGKLYRNANFIVRWLNMTILPFLMRKPKTAANLVIHTLLRKNLEIGKYYEDTDVVNIAKFVEKDKTRIFEEIQKYVENF